MIKEAPQNVLFLFQEEGFGRCATVEACGLLAELFLLRELRKHERGSLAAPTHGTLEVF